MTEGDKMEINDLKPSTVYLFKVRAKNEVGFGTPYEISISTVPVRKYNLSFLNK